jgi:hypothetical protein
MTLNALRTFLRFAGIVTNRPLQKNRWGEFRGTAGCILLMVASVIFPFALNLPCSVLVASTDR